LFFNETEVKVSGRYNLDLVLKTLDAIKNIADDNIKCT